MLSVKLALAKADQVLCYVFDEVDAGVGGKTAEQIGHKLRALSHVEEEAALAAKSMGQKLKALSQERQVIVVTHLPQIAAFADQHLRVEKTTKKGRTRVQVSGLEGDARTREIARMLGSWPPSPEALAHAEQMLGRHQSGGATSGCQGDGGASQAVAQDGTPAPSSP